MKTYTHLFFVVFLYAVFAVSHSAVAQVDPCSVYSAGTGHGATTYETPANNSYNYSVTEMIYAPWEIDAQPGLISKIEFEYAYNSGMNEKLDVDIYMANVSQPYFYSSTEWIVSDLMLVYSGTLNCSGMGQWNTIQLNTDFNWTGGNLLVVIDDNSGSFDGESYTWFCTETGGFSVLRIQSNETNFTVSGTGSNWVGSKTGSLSSYRPNTRFCIDEICTRRSGLFSFSEDTVSYMVGYGTFVEPRLDTSSYTSLNPYTGTIAYFSSDESIATVDAVTGEVTLTGSYGRVTIYAIATYGDYCPAKASYVIDVTDECKQIGRGTNLTASVPISTGSKYSYSQIIYTATEVGCGGKINAIGFESIDANSVGRTIEIYMGETDKSSFATATMFEFIDFSDLQLVYSGTWNITEGWQMFDLQNVFMYSGLHNLVVAVKGGAANSYSSNFAYTSVPDYRTLYCYSDTDELQPPNMASFLGDVYRSHERPNTKICIDCCEFRPAFQFENTEAICYLGANCPMLTLVNTSPGMVHYKTSVDTVAMVDDNGVIAIVGEGETTITALLEMSGDTCPARASYILRVECPTQTISVVNDTICDVGIATVSATTSDGGELLWYDAEDAATPVSMGNTYTIVVDTTSIFYVSSYSETYRCYSPRVPVRVDVFDMEYDSTSQNISGYVNVQMYGYPPAVSIPGTLYSSTDIPSWLTLNTDGSFSGTPTIVGNGSFTVVATNGDCSKNITINWTVEDNNLTCCDPSAFYIYKDGDPLPVRMDEDGFYYINVCKDETATFRVEPLSTGCTGYTYTWSLTSSSGTQIGEQTGSTFNYIFTLSEGYNDILTVSKADPDACSLVIPIRVLVSGGYQVDVTPGYELCKGDRFNINVMSTELQSQDWSYTVAVDTFWTDCAWQSTYSESGLQVAPPVDFTGTGTYDVHIRDEYGCETIYNDILTITIFPTVDNTDTVTDKCDTYIWSRTNLTYTESGTFISNMFTDHGCLDRDTLVLELNHSYDINKDTAVCLGTFPFDWYDVHFTEAGTQIRNLHSLEGCDSIVTLTVRELPKLEMTLTGPDNNGGCPQDEYVVRASVLGGTEPYTYTWTGYIATGSILTITVDTCGIIPVEVVVTDDKGCKDTATTNFQVIDNEGPTFLNPIVETDALRPDSCRYLVPDIIAMVHPSDSCGIVSQVQTPHKNYELSGDTNVIVVVEDACGNKDSISVLVRAPSSLSDTLIVPTINCPSDSGSTYELSIGVGGGIMPYTYQWRATEAGHSPVTSNDSVFGIVSDGKCHSWTVSVTVTDARGCKVIHNNVLFDASDSAPPQANMGSLQLESIGTTCKYIVPDLTGWARGNAWDNCTRREDLVVVEQAPAAGDTVDGWRDAFIVVADKCGNRSAQIQVRLTVEDVNTISHRESYVDVTCYGGSDGSFEVFDVYGGQSPYTYIFRGDTVTTTESSYVFTNLYAGGYDTLIIKDANGCTDINPLVEIGTPERMTLTFTNNTSNPTGRNVKICKDLENSQTVTVTADVSGNNGTPIFVWHQNGVENPTISFVNPDSTTSGVYMITVTDDNCTVTDSVRFTVNYPSEGVDSQLFCVDQGTSSARYYWHRWITLSSEDINNGSITYPYRVGRNTVGCDSSVVLHLSIKHNTMYTDIVDTCDSYIWHDSIYSSPTNTATFDTVNIVGCDSTTTLHLTLRYSTVVTELRNECDSYTWHGTIYTASTDTVTFDTINSVGCDSTEILSLTIRKSTIAIVEDSACDTYTWHDSIYISPTDTATFDTVNIVGCDSTTTLHLTLRYSNTGIEDTSVCDSYTWHGTTYTESNNTYTLVLRNVANCDSTVTLNLTVRYSSDSLYQDTVCDSLRWPTGSDSLYSSSTSEPYPSTLYSNAAGCDSTVYLALVVKHSTVIVDTQNVCDTFVWSVNGETYTESTREPIVFMGSNNVGCDSVISLDLTIRRRSDSTEVADVCDSLVWHGSIYREAIDTIAFDTINAVGCDSTVMLKLTLRYSDTVESRTDTICADGSLEWYGVSYNEQGTYRHILPDSNSVGCDSVETFILVVHDTNHVYVYDTCGYLELPWTFNDRIYEFKTEDDIFELRNQYGCDSTLHYYLQPVWKCDEFIQFPSVVTPNGDGVNDRFVVINLLEGGCYPHNHLSIFNRWGFLLYERENIKSEDEFWDPVDMPEGTYFFRFDGYGFDDKMERRGSFEIIK